MTTDVVPILRVSEVARAVEWYRRLGFVQVFEHRFEPHLPAYVGIRREGAQIHLSEHSGDANPHGLVYIWVSDIDAIAVEFGAAVDDEPWAREVSLADPDGNRLRVAEPVQPDAAPDTALVTYRSTESSGDGNRASVWIRRNGRWYLDFHQGTPSA